MADRPPSRSTAWRWWIAGPLLVIAGAALGRMYPEWVGRDRATVWREPGSLAQDGLDVPRLPSLAPILDRVRPGVVAITTIRAADTLAPRPPLTADPAKRFTRGTGFVVHAGGLIVTSQHVIADYSRIRVDVPGLGSHEAIAVGEDAVSDLALLRLANPPEDLTVLTLGDSSRVRQGDFAMSIGNPFEFHGSLSVGWITFVGRHLTEEGVHVTNEYLQFSAPVNPGESGAPLFDARGHVIGVTRRTLNEGRGISFAVPCKIVKALLRAVERGDSRVRRGYVGMEFRAPTRGYALRGLPGAGGGAEVTRVVEGHPADVAGVRVGDVILTFDGETVRSAAHLYDRITEAPPGSDTELSLFRRGAVLTSLTVTIAEVGKPAQD